MNLHPIRIELFCSHWLTWLNDCRYCLCASACENAVCDAVCVRISLPFSWEWPRTTPLFFSPTRGSKTRTRYFGLWNTTVLVDSFIHTQTPSAQGASTAIINFHLLSFASQSCFPGPKCSHDDDPRRFWWMVTTRRKNFRETTLASIFSYASLWSSYVQSTT